MHKWKWARAIAMPGFIIMMLSTQTEAQERSARETIATYTTAQKRLLVINTAQFIKYVSDDQLDQDGMTAMACRITGMPFLFPYTGGFSTDVFDGAGLINAGRVSEASGLLEKKDTAERIPLLIGLSIWYLHQPGVLRSQLDSAKHFLGQASILSRQDKYGRWQDECAFLRGELFEQQGKIRQSKQTFLLALTSGLREQNDEKAARAYQCLAKLCSNSDSTKLTYFQKSLALYQKLKLKEKQIELLMDITYCNKYKNARETASVCYQILAIMRATGFRHVLYAENVLSFCMTNFQQYIEALDHAKVALANMQWAGFDVMAAKFYFRIGCAWWTLGKKADAFQWCNRGICDKRKDSHVFWYRNIFTVYWMLLEEMGRPKDAITFYDSVTHLFPPASYWEELQILIGKGYGYEIIGEVRLADKCYMQFIHDMHSKPGADPYHQLTTEEIKASEFYLSQNKLLKARLFLKQAFSDHRNTALARIYRSSLLYKMDSVAHHYRSALENHIKYTINDDSLKNRAQLLKFEELSVKLAAQKKDRDIELLRHRQLARQAQISQSELTQKVIVGSAALLLAVIILLYRRSRLKQKSNREANQRNLGLQQMIEEKEWLLKEVHHRVKNNLHTVICLLESQSRNLRSDALRAIECSRHRLYAMSLIHQYLYQFDNLSTIDMSEWLVEYTHFMEENFATRDKVHFVLNTLKCRLDVGQAVPIALIINEAVTNAIQHAFPEDRSGKVDVALRCEAGKIFLVISDDGIGIDENPAIADGHKLGLKLINRLSESMQGTTSISTHLGTTVSITCNADAFYNVRSIKISEEEVLA